MSDIIKPNSDYEARLATLAALGGDTGLTYDSVYEIDLAILSATTGGTGGGVPEAPKDGSIYGRKDGAWAKVEGGSGSGDYIAVESLDDIENPTEGMIANCTDYKKTVNEKIYTYTRNSTAAPQWAGILEVKLSNGHFVTLSSNGDGYIISSEGGSALMLSNKGDVKEKRTLAAIATAAGYSGFENITDLSVEMYADADGYEVTKIYADGDATLTEKDYFATYGTCETSDGGEVEVDVKGTGLWIYKDDAWRAYEVWIERLTTEQRVAMYEYFGAAQTTRFCSVLFGFADGYKQVHKANLDLVDGQCKFSEVQGWDDNSKIYNFTCQINSDGSYSIGKTEIKSTTKVAVDNTFGIDANGNVVEHSDYGQWIMFPLTEPENYYYKTGCPFYYWRDGDEGQKTSLGMITGWETHPSGDNYHITGQIVIDDKTYEGVWRIDALTWEISKVSFTEIAEGGSGSGDYIVAKSLSDISSPKEGMIARLIDYENGTKTINGFKCTTTNKSLWYSWVLWCNEDSESTYNSDGEIGFVNQGGVIQYRSFTSDGSLEFNASTGLANVKQKFYMKYEEDGDNIIIYGYADNAAGFYVHSADNGEASYEAATLEVPVYVYGKGEFIYTDGEWRPYFINADVMTNDDIVNYYNYISKNTNGGLRCYKLKDGDIITGEARVDSDYITFYYYYANGNTPYIYSNRYSINEGAVYYTENGDSQIARTSDISGQGFVSKNTTDSFSRNQPIIFNRNIYNVDYTVDKAYKITVTKDENTNWGNADYFTVKLSDGGIITVKMEENHLHTTTEGSETPDVNGNLFNIYTLNPNTMVYGEDITWCAGYYDVDWTKPQDVKAPILLGVDAASDGQPNEGDGKAIFYLWLNKTDYPTYFTSVDMSSLPSNVTVEEDVAINKDVEVLNGVYETLLNHNGEQVYKGVIRKLGNTKSEASAGSSAEVVNLDDITSDKCNEINAAFKAAWDASGSIEGLLTKYYFTCNDENAARKPSSVSVEYNYDANWVVVHLLTPYHFYDYVIRNGAAEKEVAADAVTDHLRQPIAPSDGVTYGMKDGAWTAVVTISKLTQAEYDALTTKDDNTLYIITDAE